MGIRGCTHRASSIPRTPSLSPRYSCAPDSPVDGKCKSIARHRANIVS
jgi:hypothetical protein